jgi:hypothetical protein
MSIIESAIKERGPEIAALAENITRFSLVHERITSAANKLNQHIGNISEILESGLPADDALISQRGLHHRIRLQAELEGLLNVEFAKHSQELAQAIIAKRSPVVIQNIARDYANAELGFLATLSKYDDPELDTYEIKLSQARAVSRRDPAEEIATQYNSTKAQTRAEKPFRLSTF